MCGRKYAAEELNWAEYREMLNLVRPAPQTNFQPNYNIAPTHMVPVCYLESGKRTLEPLRWGLVPHWAKDPKIGFKMFNARSETLGEKTSFKGLLKDRRCVVPVSGFYEWKRDGKDKQAYKIAHESGAPMLLAGLWTDNAALDIRSYTVITTAATTAFSPIHNRMPAILAPDTVSAWLDDDWDDAHPLLAPFEGSLSVVPVSNEVGNVRNNYPELLTPLT